jgi:hypothetical protein
MTPETFIVLYGLACIKEHTAVFSLTDDAFSIQSNSKVRFPSLIEETRRMDINHDRIIDQKETELARRETFNIFLRGYSP